jgi:hypothetical protein
MTVSDLLPGSSTDRRSSTRRNCEGAAVLLVKHGIWNARLRDISARGLGVVLPHEVGAHSRLVVELFNRPGNFWYRKGLEVVHVTPQGNTWLVGSVFVQEFSAAELQELLSTGGLAAS